MSVIIAKSAGFCFGVKRAIGLVQKELDKGEEVATLGKIIHSPQVIEDFEKKGVRVIESINERPDRYHVVIRAHGVSKEMYDALEANNIPYVDATCPAVEKTHKLIRAAEKNNQIVLYAADLEHPEVVGTLGHTKNHCHVFADAKELGALLESLPPAEEREYIMFAQTTFNRAEWEKCVYMAKNAMHDLMVVDTVCNATTVRQREADEMAKKCECMVVVGGRWSSNTTELAETCKRHCQTIMVESADQLEEYPLEGMNIIGITAGASTPESVIMEIKELLLTKTQSA